MDSGQCVAGCCACPAVDLWQSVRMTLCTLLFSRNVLPERFSYKYRVNWGERGFVQQQILLF